MDDFRTGVRDRAPQFLELEAIGTSFLPRSHSLSLCGQTYVLILCAPA